MIPVSLHIERFGSFVKPTGFEFKGPGLYFLQGRNEVEPRLEANGTGKTTIWRALTWCLFGKDARGLKAGDVANWETPKGAQVAFSFEMPDEPWLFTVERKHSPNSWKFYYGCEDDPGGVEDLVADATNPVYERLRLEFEPWLNCVLMAQGEPMFLDLRADAKASLFAEVMGLDRWLTYAQNAGRLAAAEETRQNALGREIAGVEGKRAGLADQAFLEQSDAWEATRQKRLASVVETYEREMLRSKGLKAKVDEVKGWLDSKVATLLEIRAINKKFVESLAGNVKRCPECGQLVKSAEDARRLEQHEQALRNGGDDVRETERDLAVAHRELALHDKRLDELEDQADAIQEEENPFERLAASAARDRAALNAELDELQERHRESAERAALLGFWVRGFKDLRLGLIADALEELAIEVNSCAVALGLVGWELLFEVDRETKTGSIARGFSVYVRSPHNDRAVPWSSWSGGEAQRLRLATQLGLANLIRSTTGASIALEVWDEPTSGMSARGISDLLEALKTRAQDEQREIWLVDHRSLGYGGFDGGAVVVKDTEGSRLE